jgi:hypothetical protein
MGAEQHPLAFRGRFQAFAGRRPDKTLIDPYRFMLSLVE